MQGSPLLQDDVRPREVWAWALYDFANSGYTTVVLTAVFNAYFVGVVARGEDWGTLAWTATLSASNLMVMLLAPLLGRWVDGALGRKKQVLVTATVVCVLSTWLLGQTGPTSWVLILGLVLLSNAAYSVGESTIASYLPALARPETLGRLSGWGWSLGYFGGMLTLGLSLAYVLSAQAAGERAEQFVPVTLSITAAVYALAAWPSFVFLKDRLVSSASPTASLNRPVTSSLRSALRAWQRLAAELPELAALLRCIVAYQAGIAVVIAVAAVYAEQVLGFKTSQTMALIFLVNIASAVGAFAFGYAQDRLGHRRMLSAAIMGWVVMAWLAAAAQGPELFWASAVLAGLCMGSSQSASRAMAALFAPAARRAEVLAWWGSAVRLASVVGPVSYGLVTWLSQGQHRLAVLATSGFFLGGWMLLRRVEVERGQHRARELSLSS